tara:strand:- start:866 stop:967 length:102 start_codon:yes stop_codon:yes gene_type:complete
LEDAIQEHGNPEIHSSDQGSKTTFYLNEHAKEK